MISYLLTFATGVVSGAVIESLRFRYLSIKDNWNDLKAPMEKIYDAIRRLYNDSDHALKVLNEDSKTFRLSIAQINQNLEEYRDWFKALESQGGIKKLDSIDEELSSAFTGISFFSRFSQNDPEFVEKKLHRFHEIVRVCHERLDCFMKAKIPHYVIFGKRRLVNWRECRF